MKFAETLDAKQPILRLGRYRLRFDTHMLVAEHVPPLDWLRFAPELALITFAACAITTGVLLASPSEDAARAALPVGLLAIVSALVAVRLEIRKRRRRAFVLNYATRTLRLDDTTRLFGTTRTRLIPFADIAEAGVTRAERGGYAFEVELKPVAEKEPPRVEVLVSGIPDGELDALFRFSEMARAAFGLEVPPT